MVGAGGYSAFGGGGYRGGGGAGTIGAGLRAFRSFSSRRHTVPGIGAAPGVASPALKVMTSP